MMKHLQVLPVLLGLFFVSAAGMANAQSAGEKAEAPLTRGQVKMEREEFIKTHQYDLATETWVLKPGVEAPAGMMSRAEIKAAREEFLRNNRYDIPSETWVPLKAARDISTLSRDQMRAESRQFVRTHRWDPVSQTWVEQASRAKKK